MELSGLGLIAIGDIDRLVWKVVRRVGEGLITDGTLVLCRLKDNN